MGIKTIPLTKNSIGFSNPIGLGGNQKRKEKEMETKNRPEDDPGPV